MNNLDLETKRKIENLQQDIIEKEKKENKQIFKNIILIMLASVVLIFISLLLYILREYLITNIFKI